MKINKRQFNRWLKSLYEEEFPQTKRALQSKEGYCCLGVGCEILIPKNKKRLINGFLIGGLPQGQINAPEWLKKVDVDFYQKTTAYLSVLNDMGTEDLGRFSHSEIAMLLDLVYNYKILN